MNGTLFKTVNVESMIDATVHRASTLGVSDRLAAGIRTR